jgi:hypothetical protein
VGWKPHLASHRAQNRVVVKHSNCDYGGNSGSGVCAAIVRAVAVAYKGDCMYMCVCSERCMVQQPLSRVLRLKVSQCLSWLRKEMQKHSSSTTSGEGKRACGTENKVGDAPAAHQDHGCFPQSHLV